MAVEIANLSTRYSVKSLYLHVNGPLFNKETKDQPFPVIHDRRETPSHDCFAGDIGHYYPGSGYFKIGSRPEYSFDWLEILCHLVFAIPSVLFTAGCKVAIPELQTDQRPDFFVWIRRADFQTGFKISVPTRCGMAFSKRTWIW